MAGERTEHIIVTMTLSDRASYRQIRDTVTKALNALPGVLSVKVRSDHIPDRYSLSNPDETPPDFA